MPDANQNPPKKLSAAAQRKIAERESMERLEAYLQMGKDAGCPAEQMANFCRSGLILQPKQLLFAAYSRAADFENGPMAVAYGGARGGGKSFCILAQVGADDCQRYPGLKVLFLRKVGKSNREQFEDFRKRVFALLPHEYREQKGILTFKNGSTIVIGHFKDEKDIDNYLGLEYDVIAIEEATTLTNSKYLNILTCLRSSKPGWRPRAYLSTNPGNVGHQWFKSTFILPYMQKAEHRTRFVPATVRDNKFVNKEYVTEVLENLTGWQREAWLNGNWDVQAGQFFTTFRESVHVLAEWDERQAVRWYAALDYGWNHYTVFHLAAEDKSGNLVVVETHRARQTNVEGHASAINYMLSKRNLQPFNLQYIVAGKDCFSRHPDGTTVADQYAQFGIHLQPAEIDRINGWSTVLRRLGDSEKGIKPTLFVHRRCSALIDQFPVMQHDPNKPEDVMKLDADEEGRGGDDDMDALRFLVASNPNSVISFAKPLQVGRNVFKYRAISA